MNKYTPIMHPDLVLSLESINYSSTALQSLIHIIHHIIEECIFQKKLVDLEDQMNSPCESSRNEDLNNSTPRSCSFSTKTFLQSIPKRSLLTLNNCHSQDFIRLQFLQGSEKIGNVYCVGGLFSDNVSCWMNSPDFGHTTKNDQRPDISVLTTIPFGATHALFHFNSAFYTKLIWDALNGKFVHDIFKDDQFCSHFPPNPSSRICLTFWNENQNFIGSSLISTPSSDRLDSSMQFMHSQSKSSHSKSKLYKQEKEDDTKFQFGSNLTYTPLSSHNQHEGIIESFQSSIPSSCETYDTKSSADICNNSSDISNDFYSTEMYSTRMFKRKRDISSIENDKASMQDILTPRLKRRRRAKSLEPSPSYTSQHDISFNSVFNHPTPRCRDMNELSTRTHNKGSFEPLFQSMEADSPKSPFMKTQNDSMDMSTPPSQRSVDDFYIWRPFNVDVTHTPTRKRKHRSRYPNFQISTLT